MRLTGLYQQKYNKSKNNNNKKKKFHNLQSFEFKTFTIMLFIVQHKFCYANIFTKGLENNDLIFL